MKKIFIPLMLCAVAFSSCSKDEPNAESGTTYSSDLIKINVSSGTTRGTDTTTATLEGTTDNAGTVSLYIFDDGVDDNKLKGKYVFTFDGSDWDQSEIKWSDLTFPATFLSMHDGEAKDLAVSTADGNATLSYSVTGTSYEHKDLVYHASTLSAIPTGGVINAFHKHALSKVHLYAATGGNKVYVARVQFVNVKDSGTVTIEPIAAADVSTTSGVEWKTVTSYRDYVYFDIDSYNGIYSSLVSSSDGSIIINDDYNAPFMIIPQTTTATTSTEIKNNGITASGSYIEVIYYMTDSDGNALVGYSSVSKYPDAASYIDADQTKTLYVMGAFPVGHEFLVNKEYDITLGLGKSGSTGGLLLVDYYVDKDGNAVKLTKTDDEDGDDTTDNSDDLDITDIDPGDSILGDSDKYICITVTAHDWDDGVDTTTGITAN